MGTAKARVKARAPVKAKARAPVKAKGKERLQLRKEVDKDRETKRLAVRNVFCLVILGAPCGMGLRVSLE